MTANQKALIAFIVGLLVGVGATWLWYEKGSGAAMKAAETPLTGEMSDVSPESSQVAASVAGVSVSGEGSISVLPQPAGMTVAIAQVVMPQSGWVVIHEDNAGAPGRVLGAQRFDMGTFTGAVDLLRGTVAGGIYYAMLHADDGDRQYDTKKDPAMLSLDGTIIMTTFMVQ